MRSDLLKSSGALQRLEENSLGRRAESDKVKREVGSILAQYNQYVRVRLVDPSASEGCYKGPVLTHQNETVSGLFLDIHQTLEALEDKVARAERKKRKEMQERY